MTNALFFEALSILLHLFSKHIVKKKYVHRDSHIASSLISQNCFFEKVRCLILASSQKKLRG